MQTLPIVESAQPADSKEFRHLLVLSAGYFPLLFGPHAYDVLAQMFVLDKNLFSYRHTLKITLDGRTSVMLLGYDYATKKAEELHTGWLLWRHAGRHLLPSVGALWRFNQTVGRLNPGCYYISNIATFAEFRHRGLASIMMEYVASLASEQGLQYLVLDVEADNQPAISLYRQTGFNLQELNHVLLKGKRLHFLRMIKTL
ncbi:MAG TPA: N-acetyltransferase [Flammeovirgaceae bacterium]|nr:N-acetyltransferase [Flammeovirgaceae bacterium]